MAGMVVGGTDRAAYQPDDDVTFVSALSNNVLVFILFRAVFMALYWKSLGQCYMAESRVPPLAYIVRISIITMQ